MKRALALLCLLWLGACAVAPPALSGGSTTPHGRADVAVGGAARVAFGDLRPVAAPDPDGYARDAQATGIAPVVAARYGVGEHLDLGLGVAGGLARAELRRERVLAEGSTRPSVVYGVAPYVGFAEGDPSGRTTRFGLDLPLTYSVDFGGVYELWLGPRVGIEWVRGELPSGGTDGRVRAGKLSAGALLGLALGFRRLHVMLELNAAYERWWGEHGGASLRRGGLVLTPAFALRLRI